MGQADYEAGGYYERNGIVAGVGPGGSKRRSLKQMLVVPNSKWTWNFSLVTLVQCIAALALEVYVFGEFQASLNTKAINQEEKTGDDDSRHSAALTIPTYLALFIFGFLYELVLVWDALRLKNTIQVIGICLYNLGMLIYSSVEMEQVNEAVKELVPGFIEPDTYQHLRPFLTAAPCVIALGTALLGFIAWKLYHEFAWTIYKHISADLRLKRRYLTYQIYIALLKFDFFFFLGFTVQFLVVVQDQQHDAEFYITIVAMPITIVLLTLAAYFVRKESYFGHSCIIVVYFAAMVYFIFKMVRMYDSSREKDYLPIRHSLTTFAVLTILLLLITIGTAFFCMYNFNHGLAPHVQKRVVAGPDDAKYSAYEGGYNGTAHPLGPVPARMTID